MRIDKRMNLVVPIYGEETPKLDAGGKPVMQDGEPVLEQPVIAYVHSTPLSAEVVDRYWMILAQTNTAIFSRGLGVLGGPSVAMRLLKSLAMEQKIWDDDARAGLVGVKHGVVDEIARLTTVSVPDTTGWMSVPLDVAVQRSFISEDDKTEVENAIAFFIAASATLPRAQRKEMVTAAAGLWSALISPLNSSEFTASLKTSTATGNSGEKFPAPVPDAPGPATATVDGKPASVPR